MKGEGEVEDRKQQEEGETGRGGGEEEALGPASTMQHTGSGTGINYLIFAFPE